MNGEYKEALNLFLEGARDGDALASYNYAYCLLNGIGTERDASLAKTYFSFARDLPGGEACYNLALLYMHGDGVRADLSKSLSYMRDAATMGCIEAQLYLGMAYTVGCLYEPDIIGICMIPYHKPEYRADDSALLTGYIEDSEKEDRRYAVIGANARAAYEWFMIAARHDPTYVGDLVAKGKYLYAKCYIDGLGTDQDFVRGARLMLSAGREGSREAIQFLSANGVSPAMLESKSRVRKKEK